MASSSGIGLTGDQFVEGAHDALVEGACIGGRLERESVALFARLPVMKCGHHLVVLQLAVDRTAQDHLATNRAYKHTLILDDGEDVRRLRTVLSDIRWP